MASDSRNAPTTVGSKCLPDCAVISASASAWLQAACRHAHGWTAHPRVFSPARAAATAPGSASSAGSGCRRPMPASCSNSTRAACLNPASRSAGPVQEASSTHPIQARAKPSRPAVVTTAATGARNSPRRRKSGSVTQFQASQSPVGSLSSRSTSPIHSLPVETQQEAPRFGPTHASNRRHPRANRAVKPPWLRCGRKDRVRFRSPWHRRGPSPPESAGTPSARSRMGRTRRWHRSRRSHRHRAGFRTCRP
jgi:hypothetical protein